MITVTKRFTFAAAHYLHNCKLGKSENVALFGKCTGIRSNSEKMIAHGHNYILEVSVRNVSEIDNETGMVINFADLKRIVNKTVIEKFDHKNICEEVSHFCSNSANSVPATAENMLKLMACDLIEELFEECQSKVELVRLRLYETENSWADWYGPIWCGGL